MGLRQTLVKVGPKVYCPESLFSCVHLILENHSGNILLRASQ